MHHRLSHENTRVLSEVNRRLESSFDTVHEKLDKSELHAIDQMDRAIAILITERKVLGEVSTWPWRPETYLIFSTFTLPVILYVVTALVGRPFDQPTPPNNS
jgi:hypothetical protein